jgi:hypothetical protein
MNWQLKNFIVILTVFALLMVPCTASFAQDIEKDAAVTAGQMAGDALVARPLGLCATVIGSGLFIISLPFSLLGRNTGDALDYLVVDPAKFTFTRSLGDF